MAGADADDDEIDERGAACETAGQLGAGQIETAAHINEWLSSPE